MANALAEEMFGGHGTVIGRRFSQASAALSLYRRSGRPVGDYFFSWLMGCYRALGLSNQEYIDVILDYAREKSEHKRSGSVCLMVDLLTFSLIHNENYNRTLHVAIMLRTLYIPTSHLIMLRRETHFS